ncbi:hypothetical protein BYT27DRAFT_7185551 [Phlegmacium glaucopus]|nr:hypothetical protein BYT27DRAFT_7185551 [Phlegmacium glaucopus]
MASKFAACNAMIKNSSAKFRVLEVRQVDCAKLTQDLKERRAESQSFLPKPNPDNSRMNPPV